MTDPTDAAVEALAEELWTVWCGSTLPLEWKNAGISIKDRIRRLGSHVLASRQPKPEDVDHLAWVMQQAEVGWRFNTASAPSTEHAQARAILALYDAPARIPTRSALDSALDPILGNSNARRAVVDAVLGVCGAPTEADDRLATTLFQRNAYKGDRDIANARIVDLEAELAADSEAVSELRDDLERALSELAAAKSASVGTIRLGEGLTEAQERWSAEDKLSAAEGALSAANSLAAMHWSSTHEGFRAWTQVYERLMRLSSALRASAAPKAEAVDWLKIAKEHRRKGDSPYGSNMIIDHLCEQLTALRSAAGGSV